MKKPKLESLIEFFENYEFKDETVILDQCTKITNPKKFVNSHIKFLKNNPGNNLFIPSYDRLLKLSD